MIKNDVRAGNDTRIFQKDLVNLYGCEIGNNCKIGAFVEIRKDVKIGNNVKIQAFVFIPEGVTIEDGVFIGPHVCFINDKYPRAINQDGSLKEEKDWKVIKTLIKKGVPSDKIEVIYNWCDNSILSQGGQNEELSRDLNLFGRFNIIFAGNMGKAQALDAVLEAATLVYNKCPDVQFVFIGDGIEVENLKKKTKLLELKNVLFLARRPVNEIGDILNLADVLLAVPAVPPNDTVTDPADLVAVNVTV